MTKDPLVKPFLKWAGGKRQLLADLKQFYPQDYERYFEPFVGAGAVFMDMQPPKLTINDFNEELINTYIVIQNDLDHLLALLEAHAANHTKDYYYTVRAWDRNGILDTLEPAERAARLIYLNKTCYNGLFRVNSQGQFNVPFGNYNNPNIVNADTLRAVHHYFSERKDTIEIRNEDFETACAAAKKGDFVYFDPPYAPITANKQSFVGYTLNGFGEKEQERLRDLFVRLDKKGCFVMLSNADVPLIRNLYQDYAPTTHVASATRAINSKSSGRGKVDEVIITNRYPYRNQQ
ncbi:MAG: DNA adenine methylase [Sporolactobacillus sp.]